MQDPSKTNQELIKENTLLKQKIQELEQLEVACKRAEEALKQSEVQYRLLADHIKDHVWLMDLNLKPTYISPSIEKSRGYTLNEIAQLPLDKHLTATSLQSALEFFSVEMPKALADSTYYLMRSLELEFYRKDGSTFWLENSFSLIRDESGKPFSILGVGREITERKRVEDTLRENEERYRHLVETSHDWVWETDYQGVYTYASPQAQAIMGYTQDEIIGKRPFDLMPDGEARRVEELFSEIASKSGSFQRIENINRHKDGHLIILETNGTPFFDKEGKLLGYRGMDRDITNQKRAEEALRENEEKYRTVADFTFAWESWIAPSGNYLYVSPACERISGYRVEEFQQDQHLLEKITHPDDRERIVDHIHDVLQGESDARELEFRIITRIGKECWINHTCQDVYSQTGEYVGRRSSNHDITALKQAEEELRFHSEIMDNMAEAVYLIRMEDGVIVYSNSIFERMFGYEPGEMLGKHVSIVNAPTEKSPVETAKEIMDEINEKGSWQGEVNNVAKDGKLFWCYANVSVFDHSKYGRVFVSIHTDITERRRADDALRASESRLQEAQRIARIGDWEWDIVTNNVYWSDELYRIYGYEPKEISPVFELVLQAMQPGSRDVFLDEIDASLKGEKAFDMEFDFLRKDGSVSSLHTVGHVIRDENGTPLRMKGIVQDITSRKQTEADLKRSEEKYRDIFENTMEGIYRSTPEGRFVILNPAFARICGYASPEEMMDKVTDIANQLYANPEDRLHFQNLIATEGVVKDLEVQFNHPTKGLIWISLHSKVIRNEHGDIQFCDGTIEDITEHKRMEEYKAELESQSRQLQKSESLGRMAGAIAHHFNNQLGVVIGNLEMAIDDLPQGAGTINSLTAAMQAAGKAAEMSSLMLTYLGQTSGKRQTIDISEVCLRSLPILQATIPNNVIMETDLPSPGPVISANASHIQQVITNLVTNAWESVGENRGSIHLGVKAVPAANIPAVYRFPMEWQPQNNAYACLEVIDNGCGIADKDIEKLFDPFFSSKFTGRGMGLAVVRGIVRAHGGVVTVETKLGRGSTFRVFLPVTAEEVCRQPDKTPRSLAIEKGGTVLLVEDEEMVRNMAAAMLKRMGFAVLEANDGVEAVEVFRQRWDEIRCVISDLTMPRMSGWETLTALRKLAPDIPVIIASGYDKSHVMAGEHPELPQAFLGKPYRLKELSDAISQALAGGK